MQFPSQTPLYYATNRERYERQELIRKIEELTGRHLIVYVANFNHPLSNIRKDDCIPFNDICFELPNNCKIDFMIHSPGGDPNTAEQIVNILLSKSQDIRVIVPLSAKSAATMISLVADTIVMSDSSELGPIDPQVPIHTPQGITFRPAKALLQGIEKIKSEVIDNNNYLNPTYYPILQWIDPAFITFCEMAVDHSKKIAQKWLERSMCKNNPQKAKEIAEQLVDIEKYPNHGAVINWQEAQKLGLNVEYLHPRDPFWEAIWRLFCKYDVDIKNNKLVKIFEGNKASVSM